MSNDSTAVKGHLKPRKPAAMQPAHANDATDQAPKASHSSQTPMKATFSQKTETDQPPLQATF
jgi:hypothetical protein